MEEEHIMGYDIYNKELGKELFNKIVSNVSANGCIRIEKIGSYEARHIFRENNIDYYLDISFVGAIRLTCSKPNFFYIPIIDCYEILNKYYIQGTLVDGEELELP